MGAAEPTAGNVQADRAGSKVRTPRFAPLGSGHDAGAPGGSHPPVHQLDADTVLPGTFGHRRGLKRAPDRGAVGHQQVTVSLIVRSGGSARSTTLGCVGIKDVMKS